LKQLRLRINAKTSGHSDEADDHSGDTSEKGPSDVVMGLILPEPPRFGFIT
jgi:hypothetical protein